MSRRLVGSWSLPSGNSADVYLGVDGDDGLFFEWDSVPPARDAVDRAHYEGVVLPAVVRRVQELLEKPGPALVVQL